MRELHLPTCSVYNYQMPLSRTAIGLLIVTITMVVGSCGGSASVDSQNNDISVNADQSNSSNAAKTNAEELGMLVNLPYEAEDIAWKHDESHKKVVAVLKFSPSDAAELVAEAEKIRPAIDVQIPAEAWFPAELIAQGDVSGDNTLSGRSFEANEFLLAPYTRGTITRINSTDFFVLEVSN